MILAPKTALRIFGLLTLVLATAAATQQGRDASVGVYSKTQAARGAQGYAAHCASCHGDLLQGIDVAPPLTGSRFLSNWLNQTSDALFTRIKTTMPQNDPGTLGTRGAVDIMAYILQTNGFSAGTDDLPSSAEELQQIRIDAPITPGH